jgi:hypothetical protein
MPKRMHKRAPLTINQRKMAKVTAMHKYREIRRDELNKEKNEDKREIGVAG